MFRRSDVTAAELVYLLAAALLLTHQASAGVLLPAPGTRDGGVVGHTRHTRGLEDDDLLTPVLSMFSGGPRSRCCKQLTLCDLATTLLQAVEANKAQDVETLRKRKGPQPAWQPFRAFSARYRRAEQDPEDTPPNPVLVDIARTYMKKLHDDEHARRAEALRRAQATLAREHAAAAAEAEAAADVEDEDEDEPGAPEATTAAADPNASSAVQKIAPLHSS